MRISTAFERHFTSQDDLFFNDITISRLKPVNLSIALNGREVWSLTVKNQHKLCLKITGKQNVCDTNKDEISILKAFNLLVLYILVSH